MDVISFVFVLKKMFLIFVIADNYMKLKIGHLKLDHSVKWLHKTQMMTFSVLIVQILLFSFMLLWLT